MGRCTKPKRANIAGCGCVFRVEVTDLVALSEIGYLLYIKADIVMDSEILTLSTFLPLSQES